VIGCRASAAETHIVDDQVIIMIIIDIQAVLVVDEAFLVKCK